MNGPERIKQHAVDIMAEIDRLRAEGTVEERYREALEEILDITGSCRVARFCREALNPPESKPEPLERLREKAEKRRIACGCGSASEYISGRRDAYKNILSDIDAIAKETHEQP